MNDPIQRPVDPPPPHDVPPHDEPPRKGVNPLLWILLLIVLVALGWYFLSQREATTTQAPLPDVPVIGDGQAPPPEPEPGTATRPSTPAPATRPAVPADREASPVDSPEPTYPPAAARSREQGTVILLVQVDADGSATDVTIETRSGSRDLDRAAVDAVRKWTFQPAIEGGKPVASAVRVPVDFKLDP
ncbi:TonB family protein [Luteimonas sp. BDR2-5]|uniref:energy transducer TonB n=1 Tax=Proluteimonas luteida TaxID=2878685 RepID=UPI001E29D7C8|nr:energy transducer TonB [Luteimonas sp. BDR2-5]MCD9026863.1 TonB family protein [Luteimonas sp. BDR2-5]